MRETILPVLELSDQTDASTEEGERLAQFCLTSHQGAIAAAGSLDLFTTWDMCSGFQPHLYHLLLSFKCRVSD